MGCTQSSASEAKPVAASGATEKPSANSAPEVDPPATSAPEVAPPATRTSKRISATRAAKLGRVAVRYAYLSQTGYYPNGEVVMRTRLLALGCILLSWAPRSRIRCCWRGVPCLIAHRAPLL